MSPEFIQQPSATAGGAMSPNFGSFISSADKGIKAAIQLMAIARGPRTVKRAKIHSMAEAIAAPNRAEAAIVPKK